MFIPVGEFMDFEVDKYMDWLRYNTDLSESSIALYARTARRFFEEGHDTSIDSINKFISDSFRKNRSYYVKYTFKPLLRFLKKSTKLYRLLMPVKIRPRKRMGKYYPERIIRKIILNMKKDIHRDQAMLQHATGARAREIITLREENVDFDYDVAAVRIRLIGKGGKDRVTFLAKEFAYILQKYCKNQPGYIFLSKDLDNDQEQLERTINTSRSYLYQSLRNSALSLGLKGFGTHDFRRNVAERIRKINKDPYVVKKALGHAKIETTLRYFDESPEDVQDAILSMQRQDHG